MFRIIDGRGTGKTCRAILLAKEYDGVVASKSPKAIIERANYLGLSNIRSCSSQDVIDKNYPQGKRIFIDDIECFAEHCAPGLLGYSLSTWNHDYEDEKLKLKCDKIYMNMEQPK